MNVVSDEFIAGKVAVIIVNYNGGADVLRCIDGVLLQTFQPKKIIVVDNNSTDGSADEIKQHYAGIKLIRNNTNIGFAAANNLAIEQCYDIDWLALLNPDAYPDKNWLKEMMQAIEQYPDVDFFASRLIDANTPTKLDGSGDIYHVSGLSWRRDHGVTIERTRSQDEHIFGPCAAAAIYRKQIVDAAGQFDERYFCYNEDVDLAFRMRLIGAQCLYISESFVHHIGSAITGRNSDFSIYYGHRNLVWTFFKNMPIAMLCLYLPQHIILNIVSIFYFLLQGKIRVIAKSKWDALKGLPAIIRSRKEVHKNTTVSIKILRQSMSHNWFKPYFSRYV